MGHFGPEIIVHPQSSKCTLKIYFKFCTMKWAKRHMKFILVIFGKKKILLRVKGLSWAQKCFVLKTQDML